MTFSQPCHPHSFLTGEEARQLYTTNDVAHDFDHVLRVVRLAEEIASAEGADVAVVTAAAWLHDVPVPESSRQRHHLAAADFAQTLLAGRNVPLEQLKNVVHAIQAHRYRDQSIQPQTLEAKCLYDADKLDSMGAIGVARAFAHAGIHGNRLWWQPWNQIEDEVRPAGSDYTPVHEFVYKLRHLLGTLHTKTARRIGQERHTFMVEFFERLDAEMAVNR